MTSRGIVGGIWFALAVGASLPLSAQQVFRITPVRPVAELRADAERATPPREPGPFRPSELVELVTLDSTIKLDIRYAGTDNFLSTPVYTEARAFLQRPAAAALVRAHRALRKEGYGLLIHDAYRPWYVTKIFWDATPADKHEFVANPADGSRHNRGSAVDLTLYDLRTGKAVEMPSLYDEMSPRAYPSYAGGSKAATARRELLRRAMEAEGFQVFKSEWWHFDHNEWQQYAIQNVAFEQLGGPRSVPFPERIASGGFQNVVARSGNLFIAGQPADTALRRLRAEGVTTIINLRTPPEMDDRRQVPFDEAALARELGVRYINVPVRGDSAYPYSAAALEQVAAALQQADGKVLLHCTVAYRASHMWAAYLYRYKGFTLEEAERYAKAVNFGAWPIEGFLGGKVRLTAE